MTANGNLYILAFSCVIKPFQIIRLHPVVSINKSNIISCCMVQPVVSCCGNTLVLLHMQLHSFIFLHILFYVICRNGCIKLDFLHKVW